jgi:hypothetical protein
MKPIVREYVRFTRTTSICAWISQRSDEPKWTIEVFARSPGGLYYLEREYRGEQPSLERLYEDAFAHGQFSRRPCELDQSFDASMTHSALALFYAWCRARNLSADRMLHTAYPLDTAGRWLDPVEIVTQAAWEGIVYPTAWDEEATLALGLALHEVGYGHLATVMGQTLAAAR